MAIRTVIVDDSNFIILQLKKQLGERMGHEIVATGKDGNEAVALFRQHRPDLMTLDLSMPHKRGSDAIKEIIQEFPNANIIVISAVRSHEMVNCMQLGAKGYIEKPLKLDDEEYLKDFVTMINESLGPKPA
jgi:two-component system chemotaxis response regulator CheY